MTDHGGTAGADTQHEPVPPAAREVFIDDDPAWNPSNELTLGVEEEFHVVDLHSREGGHASGHS